MAKISNFTSFPFLDAKSLSFPQSFVVCVLHTKWLLLLSILCCLSLGNISGDFTRVSLSSFLHRHHPTPAPAQSRHILQRVSFMYYIKLTPKDVKKNQQQEPQLTYLSEPWVGFLDGYHHTPLPSPPLVHYPSIRHRANCLWRSLMMTFSLPNYNKRSITIFSLSLLMLYFKVRSVK